MTHVLDKASIESREGKAGGYHGGQAPVKSWEKLIVLSALIICVGCAAAPTAPPAPAAPLPTSAQVGTTTIVAVQAAAAPCCKQTLPEFLGITKCENALLGGLHRVFSRLVEGLDLTGRFPELQPKPPLVSLTDPSNLAPDAPPAMQAAAAVKAEEDAAQQKIMALRYLATVGCGGCYAKVEDALLAALDDCTEEVRYEAVQALRGKSAYNCRYCKSSRCCSDKVRKKLNEIATEVDENGCYKEPSARVRRIARIALAACCGPTYDSGSEIPEEGPPAPMDNAPTEQVASQNSVLEDAPWSGISQVSFSASAVMPTANDRLLAEVHGMPIYESQLRPQIEAYMQAHPEMQHDRAVVLAKELQKIITWRLLTLAAEEERGQLEPTSVEEPIAALTPVEVEAWFKAKIERETVISPEELAEYERQQIQGQATVSLRWEQISVAKNSFAEADHAAKVMAYLRERAIGRTPYETPTFSRSQIQLQTRQVKELSQIAPVELRKAISDLPEGELSSIIDDGTQLHMVRVLQRQSIVRTKPQLTSDQIRRQLIKTRQKQTADRLLQQLQGQYRVWNLFDSPATAEVVPLNSLLSPQPDVVPIFSDSWLSSTASGTVNGVPQNAGNPAANLKR